MWGRHPAPRSPFDEPGLEEKRLVGVFDRLRLLTHGDGEGGQSDWAPAELVHE
jgi:hypothetical protein